MSKVRVELLRHTATKALFLRAGVASKKRLGIWSQYDLEDLGRRSEREIIKWAGVAAGAAAEHQCERYGDAHDPDDCAKEAVKLAADLLSRNSVSDVKPDLGFVSQVKEEGET